MITPASLLTRLDIDSRFRGFYRWAADEQRLPTIQKALIAVLILWAVNSLANALWVLVPGSPISVSQSVVINPPPLSNATSVGSETIDVSSILGMSVFGAAEPSEVQDLVLVTAVANPREGIEDGARETSLALTLTGIVASTADGLGSAMIEARKKQELYSVGDDLPANGKVTLSKILPKQVVIDNNGTYELITLFDDNGIVGIVQSTSSELPDRNPVLPAEASANRSERQQLAANAFHRILGSLLAEQRGDNERILIIADADRFLHRWRQQSLGRSRPSEVAGRVPDDQLIGSAARP